LKNHAQVPTEDHRDLKWLQVRSSRLHKWNSLKNAWIRHRVWKLRPKNQIDVLIGLFLFWIRSGTVARGPGALLWIGYCS